MDKNREIMDILIKIEEKYKKLRLEFIDLYKNINNICINNDNFISSKNEYENYISKENNKTFDQNPLYLFEKGRNIQSLLI